MISIVTSCILKSAVREKRNRNFPTHRDRERETNFGRKFYKGFMALLPGARAAQGFLKLENKFECNGHLPSWSLWIIGNITFITLRG